MADKTAEQAGQVVESLVDSVMQSLNKGRSKRGIFRPVFGLLVLAGGGAAVFYAQADEQQRQEASKKVNELANQVLDQVGVLSK
jgi:hypothetical protein